GAEGSGSAQARKRPREPLPAARSTAHGGSDRAVRKTAPPARTTRMRAPAASAPVEKSASPRRLLAVIRAGAAVMRPRLVGVGFSVSGCGPRRNAGGRIPSWLLDRGDRVGDLGRQLAREGGGARRLGGDLLALGARDEADVGLHELRLGGIRVLLADDAVGDQHERVVARVGGLAVE